jgi:hypothetical protein
MSKLLNRAPRYGQHRLPQATLDQHIDHAIISLSTMIHIPEEHAPTHLNRFITDYYQYMQREFRSWSQLDQTAPCISRLKVHLERHANLDNDHPQLQQLSEAYVAMRIMEEVNDHFIGRNQQPLTRYDISMANVIAGTLLGDSNTEQAEAAINRMLQEWNSNQTESQCAMVPSEEQGGMTRIYYHWPCLASQFGFSSSFADLPDGLDLQVSGVE